MVFCQFLKSDQDVVYAALLSPQGKVVADFFVWSDAGDGFVLDVDPSRTGDLERRLAPLSASPADALATLTALRGRETVERWQAQAQAGQMAEVVRDLLDNHYDPRYEESMARNFGAYPTSTRWPVTYQGAGSFEVLARQLLAASN